MANNQNYIYKGEKTMDEMNNMNNVELENNTTVETELVAEPENNSCDTGYLIAYGAGVATPFIVWGIVKGVKWIINKVRSKKEAATTEECEDEDFSEFDEE